MIIFIIVAILMIYLLVSNISLYFRHSYLRQKLLNRTDPDEQAIINKTDLDFWSFLK